MADTIIYMEGVTVTFSGFKALNDVCFYVEKGELRFLIGPNGAGKTTLLDVICGKVRPDKGRVIFKDKVEIPRLGEHKIARAGISRKFQTPSVFSNLTVFENMELALKTNTGVFSSLVHSISKKEREHINSVLQDVGLYEKASEKAGHLSHGEKQWLEIAMTVLQEPELLLVDEPVAGMTAKERIKTGELLLTIASQRSVIVVEHDMDFVQRFSKKVTVLHEGQVICEGSFEYVKNDPVVIDVYLGRGGEVQNNAIN